MYQVMVYSEEGHLAWFVKEVGKGNEGIGFLQIQNENSSNERHPLNLKHATYTSSSP